MQNRTRQAPPPAPNVAGSAAIAPASSRSVPIFMVAVFCATLGVVLVIAILDMLSPAAPAAGERAPSWPAR